MRWNAKQAKRKKRTERSGKRETEREREAVWVVNRYLPNYFVLMSSAHGLDCDIQYTQYICIFTLYIDNIFTIYIQNIYNYCIVSAWWRLSMTFTICELQFANWNSVNCNCGFLWQIQDNNYAYFTANCAQTIAPLLCTCASKCDLLWVCVSVH